MPFEIPSSWVWTNVASFTYDLQYGTSEKSSSEGSVPVLRMGNITRIGSIDYSDLVYSSNEEDIRKYELKKNDILFNRTNSSEWVGKTAIFKSETPTIYAGYLIRLRCIFLSPDYINLVMNSSYHRDWCNQVKTDAVNQSNINAQKLSNLLIPIPPYSEQLRIVSEVERWLALIEQIEGRKVELESVIKRTKSKILDLAIHGKLVSQDPNNEPASELLKRINPKAEITCDNGQYGNLPEGWCWCQFGEYLDVRDGTHDSPKYVEKGYPFVTSKNLNCGKIDFDTTKFISEEDYIKYSQRSLVEDGDILFAMIGSIGNPVLIVKDREFSIKNVALFKPYDRKYTYMEYVLYYLLYIQETLKQKAKGGMQPFIPLNYFRKDLYIPLPPIEEQHHIVTKIEELFTSLDNIQKALEV